MKFIILFLILTCELRAEIIRNQNSSRSFKIEQSDINNLTQKFSEAESQSALEIILKSKKTWIQTRHNEYRSYQYTSGSSLKPLVVFIMGLGGSIEETLDRNLLIHEYLKQKYNVLILEGSKLGETAIVALKNNFKSSFEINMDGFVDLYNHFTKTEQPKYSELIISGHSYGAYGASHLAQALNQELTLKLIAPGVTNFNNRLNPGWINLYLLGLTEIMDIYDKDSGFNYQVDQVKEALLETAPDLKLDPIKLTNSAELTVDLGAHHIFDSLRSLHPKTQIQLILGADESFIFPMMHYELYQNLVSASFDTVLVNLKDVDHHVPNHMSSKQVLSIFDQKLKKMTSDDYLNVDFKDGANSIQKIVDLKVELKEKSYQIWQNFVDQKKSENIYIGLIPGVSIDTLYPKTWKP